MVAPVELEKSLCPICHSSDLIPHFMARNMDDSEGRLYQVARCRRCSLLVTSPRPTPETMGAFYESGLYETQEGAIKRRLVNQAMRVLHQLRMRQVLRHKSVGKILDIGCGKGKFLAEAARQGWEAWGIEPSRRSLSFIEDGSGVRVYGGRFEDALLPDQYFDVITMWHTLEHFYNPLETLIKAREKLRDDGILIVRVPNSDSWDARWGRENWFHLDVPRHLYHFSPDSLTNMMAKADFQITSMSTSSLEDNPIGMLQTLMSVIGLKQGSIFRLLKHNFQDNGSSSKTGAAVTLLSAAVFALPCLAVSEIAQMAGCGDTVTISAEKASLCAAEALNGS